MLVKQIAAAFLLSTVSLVAAQGAPAPTSAAGAPPAQGTQFITGACTKDTDCASSCCGFRSGKCAGPVIAQSRDGGCGFGDAQPNDRAAQAFLSGSASQAQAGAATTMSTAAAAPSGGAGGAGSGKAPGTQFITGPCANDGECASGCCAFTTGKCAGAVVAQGRDGGCGFGNATPNADAARALGFTGQPGQA